MGDLDQSNVLAVFDQLVSDGVLVYGPHQSIVREAEGYPVSSPSRMKLMRGLFCVRVDAIQSVRAPIQEATYRGRQT